MEEPSEYDESLIRERGTFAVNLITPKARRDLDVEDSLQVHGTVLRPILGRATDCFVYGVVPGSQIYEASSAVLRRDRGRHRVDLGVDPVAGHERLWNACGGERGSIVILMGDGQFPADEVFPRCFFPHVIENYRSAHTPAAITLARKHSAAGGIAVCLSRNNGIEWMDIFAPPEAALSLYRQAFQLCPLMS